MQQLEDSLEGTGEGILEIVHYIKERIRHTREVDHPSAIEKSRPYGRLDFGEYLHSRWDVSPNGAANWIRALETGNSLQRYARANMRSLGEEEAFEERLADYLAALGLKEEEAKYLLRGLELVRKVNGAPFAYEHSDVPIYDGKRGSGPQEVLPAGKRRKRKEAA